MHLGKLNLVSLLAALGLFFLPWIEIRCQDTSMVQQSGFQAVTKKIAMSEEFEKMGNQMSQMGGGATKTKNEPGDTKELPIYAVASIGVAALALLVALGGAGSPGGSKASSFLAIVALGLAIAQMVLKFPLEKEMLDKMKKDNAPPPGAAADPMAAQMGAQFENMIKVKYLPAFWGYLAALAIPGLLGFIATPGGRYPAPPR